MAQLRMAAAEFGKGGPHWRTARRFMRALCRRLRAVGQTYLHPTKLSALSRPLSCFSTQALPPLVDSHGRVHTYLRVSLTERCNLRCMYCMPSGGAKTSQCSKRLLSSKELVRILRLFVELGITKLRFTGGEPLMRKDFPRFLKQLTPLHERGLTSVGVTTNGVLLGTHLKTLVDHGVSRVNVSLDSLDEDNYEAITHSRKKTQVLQAIQDAMDAGLHVKLNCVVMQGVNHSELASFVRLTETQPLEVRFIEYMPFRGNQWSDALVFPREAMQEQLQAEFGSSFARVGDELQPEHHTAELWAVDGFEGRVGFISSLSHPFCASCNRLRLTADGNLRACLFGADGACLRDAMRTQASDEELIALIRQTVHEKRAVHAGLGLEELDSDSRPMVSIGG